MSLAAAAQIRGPLLLVWGARDPHIPQDGRIKIHRALEDVGTDFHVRVYDAEHTFMRDEGARADPHATDRAFGANIAGAMFGGLAEYSSMILGFQYLLFVAVALYIVSIVGSYSSVVGLPLYETALLLEAALQP